MRHGQTLDYFGATGSHAGRSRGVPTDRSGLADRLATVGTVVLLAAVVVIEVVAGFVVYAVTSAVLPDLEWWSMFL